MTALIDGFSFRAIDLLFCLFFEAANGCMFAASVEMRADIIFSCIQFL